MVLFPYLPSLEGSFRPRRLEQSGEGKADWMGIVDFQHLLNPNQSCSLRIPFPLQPGPLWAPPTATIPEQPGKAWNYHPAWISPQCPYFHSQISACIFISDLSEKIHNEGGKPTASSKTEIPGERDPRCEGMPVLEAEANLPWLLTPQWQKGDHQPDSQTYVLVKSINKRPRMIKNTLWREEKFAHVPVTSGSQRFASCFPSSWNQCTGLMWQPHWNLVHPREISVPEDLLGEEMWVGARKSHWQIMNVQDLRGCCCRDGIQVPSWRTYMWWLCLWAPIKPYWLTMLLKEAGQWKNSKSIQLHLAVAMWMFSNPNSNFEVI